MYCELTERCVRARATIPFYHVLRSKRLSLDRSSTTVVTAECTRFYVFLRESMRGRLTVKTALRDDAVPEKGTLEQDDAKPSREEIVSHLLGGGNYYLPMAAIQMP
jgi:hypothetical protein